MSFIRNMKNMLAFDFPGFTNSSAKIKGNKKYEHFLQKGKRSDKENYWNTPN